ncbi:MAG: adenylosuccinate synthase [Candidatus Xenobia bacterium]
MQRLEQNTAVIGTQWGDEGKGKISHYLAEYADIVARYNGGNNAGHTVVFGGRTYKLHHLPSGVFYPSKLSVLGNGMVIDPGVLLQEIDTLAEQGVRLGENFLISPLAHVIMPYHRLRDQAQESKRGERKLGTTGRGIGPAYVDRAARTGIRMIDLLEDGPELADQIAFHLEAVPGLTVQGILDEYRTYAERLRPHVADVSWALESAFREGRRAIFEGAQGALLDVDFGTYPYVTSSHAVAGYASAGLGIAPRRIEKVLGVTKAYTTRVGTGPFPTELSGDEETRLRERGREFGTTTGRPRRCGWLDLVMIRHAARLSGVDALAVTKLDVLTGIDPLHIAVAYDLDGERITHFPQSLKQLARCKPIYEAVPGWSEDIQTVRRRDALPPACRQYLERMEHELHVPVEIISLGADHGETLHDGVAINAAAGGH